MNMDESVAPRPVRLIFIHHSSGANWLADRNGGLGIALRGNNYFVSDTNYGWGPDQIGSRTDIGHWWEWFCDPKRSPLYLDALFKESGQNTVYSRQQMSLPGENEIILFKSCFPNSTLRGDPAASVPPIEKNPVRGQKAATVPPDPKTLNRYLMYRVKSMAKALLGKTKNESAYTVANAKGIYIELLNRFREHADKLFVLVTTPPLCYSPTAPNTRAFNQWLVNDWLIDYPLKNVAVFDLFNVLTTNGGNPEVNDLAQETGNHHRWWNGAVQHQADSQFNLLAYSTGDDHAGKAGNQKATAEFVPLLNVYYHRWKKSMN
ncbi:MAG: hypothetical protein HZB19_10270 [Chloroflexi bacterium]|nr:hypothetical protein [Chloroflexota bacterium]